MNVLGLYASHDSSICVKIGNEYRIYEIERLVKQRYYSLQYGDLNAVDIYNRVYSEIVKDYGEVEFDTCYYIKKCLTPGQKQTLIDIFKVKNFVESEHHKAHAASAYYQSSFDESLIFSYDGGGWDFDGITFFAVYHAKGKEIKRIGKLGLDLGTKYNNVGRPIKEVKKANKVFFAGNLSWAGKFMGLAGYGIPDPSTVDKFKNYFSNNQLINFKNRNINTLTDTDILEGEDSYVFAASAQLAFEEVLLKAIKPYIDKYKLPVCLTGGCALNVLFNERLRHLISEPIFIPPNPNDCGLSLGTVLDNVPPEDTNLDIVYKGFNILDIDKMEEYKEQYNATEVTPKDIAELLADGKIIGIVNGMSECGPRALGNRSIVCDPSIENMKDILNSKVKFREWFRPFAPFVKREKCNEYFEFDDHSPYMSFAPKVRDEYLDDLKAISHVDQTARVQTVTEESHKGFYDLLTEFEKVKGIGVLLNTSFNIKGKPILTTIEDALSVLEETELDYVVVEGVLFESKK